MTEEVRRSNPPVFNDEAKKIFAGDWRAAGWTALKMGIEERKKVYRAHSFWCMESAEGRWFYTTMQGEEYEPVGLPANYWVGRRRPRHIYRVYVFENAKDAAIFRLTFGGELL